jgi:methyl-accepting chemotaxis protein
MSSRIGEVSDEAEKTGRHATEVHENTRALAEAMAELQRAVVRMVRTSTSEVDRRLFKRFAVDWSCRLSVEGRPPETCRMVDISEGGACIQGGLASVEGARGTLDVAEVGTMLPFKVRAVEADVLHVQFALQPAAAEKLQAALQRLGERRAA